MYFADYHVHTNFSDDSAVPMEGMIKAAVKAGLKEIAITDHIDLDYPDPEFPFIIDDIKYTKELMRLRDSYHKQINIKKGVEIGLQPHIKEDIEELMKKNDYDFIIASTHSVDKTDLYGSAFFKGKTLRQAYRRYFEDVLDCVKIFDCFNVYGHFDYINRYGYVYYGDKTFKYEDYKEIIDEILKTLIEKGKGIEINTSGYRYGLDYAHPKLSILKQYKKLGGEIVTVGSDAHNTQALADHFDAAYEMLKEAGFRAITIFEEEKPRFIDI